MLQLATATVPFFGNFLGYLSRDILILVFDKILHMNSKTTLSIFAIVAALTSATAIVATSVITANSAFAIGGPKAEKNFGQCKQDFNTKVCKKFQTGGG